MNQNNVIMNEKIHCGNMPQIWLQDFQAWAEQCVRITDKLSGREIPFRLNAPQRRVLSLLEEQRRAGKPIRLILLKARQWGGSTLIQIYMAWLQLVLRTGWNSVTCAHVKDASASIRGMYSRLLRSYPKQLADGESAKDWQLVPFEKSQTVSYLAARDAQVAIATAQSPNGVRGYNFAMAHLSEVAFWGDGVTDKAEEIVRTVCGSIVRGPDTLIVMESTANGTDNYFYDEWQRAVRGESDKTPVFVAWHEIPMYSRPVGQEERQELLRRFDDYENELLERGVSMEHVAWYHDKRREYPTHAAMMAEYPSTADEAFRTSRGGIVDEALLPEEVSRAPSQTVENELVVLVAAAPGRPAWLCRFSLADGVAHPLGDEQIHGSPQMVMNRVLKKLQPTDCQLLIVDLPIDDQPSAARRYAVLAAESDLPLVYSYEDAETLAVNAENLSELASAFGDMCARSAYREISQQALSQLHTVSLATAGRRPLAISRLAAALVSEQTADSVPIDVAELLD